MAVINNEIEALWLLIKDLRDRVSDLEEIRSDNVEPDEGLNWLWEEINHYTNNSYGIGIVQYLLEGNNLFFDQKYVTNTADYYIIKRIFEDYRAKYK